MEKFDLGLETLAESVSWVTFLSNEFGKPSEQYYDLFGSNILNKIKNGSKDNSLNISNYGELIELSEYIKRDNYAKYKFTGGVEFYEELKKQAGKTMEELLEFIKNYNNSLVEPDYSDIYKRALEERQRLAKEQGYTDVNTKTYDKPQATEKELEFTGVTVYTDDYGDYINVYIRGNEADGYGKLYKDRTSAILPETITRPVNSRRDRHLNVRKQLKLENQDITGELIIEKEQKLRTLNEFATIVYGYGVNAWTSVVDENNEVVDKYRTESNRSMYSDTGSGSGSGETSEEYYVDFDFDSVDTSKVVDLVDDYNNRLQNVRLDFQSIDNELVKISEDGKKYIDIHYESNLIQAYGRLYEDCKAMLLSGSTISTSEYVNTSLREGISYSDTGEISENYIFTNVTRMEAAVIGNGGRTWFFKDSAGRKISVYRDSSKSTKGGYSVSSERASAVLAELIKAGQAPPELNIDIYDFSSLPDVMVKSDDYGDYVEWKTDENRRERVDASGRVYVTGKAIIYSGSSAMRETSNIPKKAEKIRFDNNINDYNLDIIRDIEVDSLDTVNTVIYGKNVQENKMVLSNGKKVHIYSLKHIEKYGKAWEKQEFGQAENIETVEVSVQTKEKIVIADKKYSQLLKQKYARVILNLDNQLEVLIIPKKESTKVVDCNNPEYSILNSKQYNYGVEEITLRITQIKFGLSDTTYELHPEAYEFYKQAIDRWINIDTGQTGIKYLYD